jgi:hypothetical protein
MNDQPISPRPLPLRLVVLNTSNQDVRRCQNCSLCDVVSNHDQEISLSTLVQMVLMDDDEVLITRALWSDQVLRYAHCVSVSSLDLRAVMRALRAEAVRRGLVMGVEPDEAGNYR